MPGTVNNENNEQTHGFTRTRTCPSTILEYHGSETSPEKQQDDYEKKALVYWRAPSGQMGATRYEMINEEHYEMKTPHVDSTHRLIDSKSSSIVPVKIQFNTGEYSSAGARQPVQVMGSARDAGDAALGQNYELEDARTAHGNQLSVLDELEPQWLTDASSQLSTPMQQVDGMAGRLAELQANVERLEVANRQLQQLAERRGEQLQEQTNLLLELLGDGEIEREELR